MNSLVRNVSKLFSLHSFLLGLESSVFRNALIQSRSYGYRIKSSLKDGEAAEKASVASRFFRLPNGLWIRRQPGYHAHLWKKNWQKIQQLQKHEVLGPEDSRMLDKMVSRKTWRKRYWVDHAMDHWTNHITMQSKPPWRP